jgi:hypothetical protein
MIPLGPEGRPVSPDDLDDADDYILAVLPDDRIVCLIGHSRIRVGAASTNASTGVVGDWHWKHEIAGPAGLYSLIMDLPQSIDRECARREAEGEATAAWRKAVRTLAYQLMTDLDYTREVLEESGDAWLARIW